MIKNNINNQEISDDEIRFLPPRDACRLRPSMYIGNTGGEYGASTIFREILDNSMDVISEGYGDTILASVNFNGFCFVADNGKGLPITMSVDRPDITAAELSISEFHSGSKFKGTENLARIGINGVGSSATNFVSKEYWVLSRITQDNYDKSIPAVKECWEKAGPRSKKDLFYVLSMKEGLKADEGAGKLRDIEKKIFKGLKQYVSIPEGQSTIVLFKPDPTIFEDPRAEMPVTNLQYFLLIQEKFYKRQVNVVVDGVSLRSTFSPYKFEITKTIIPANTSYNKQVGVYITFEADDKLQNAGSFGSVNGLSCNEGAHINLFKNLYKSALRDQYKIKHDCLLNGLRFCIIILANECQFNSQTKENLKQITKVKPTDFAPVVKEIEKIFKKNPEYWDLHVQKLDQLAESMKSIGAADKAQKMMDSSSGVNQYRNKADLPKGFADATSKDRWSCELFLCFTGDTEIITCNEERIKFTDLTKRIESGEEIYTFSITSNGTIKPAKIIAAKKIKTSNKLVKVTLDNGESFSCTEDHLIMKKDGTYEAAGFLNNGDSLMPLYISTVNENGFERRIVRSTKTNEFGRIQKEFSKTEGNYYVYRVMASHKDVVHHESENNLKEGEYLVRHHLDGNSLNDYPNNLMWCSNIWHRAHHGANKLHEKALVDADLFNRVYVKSKRTDEFRQNCSDRMKNFYETEAGDEVRQHLRDSANEEWKNEELRRWRSQETAKYAKEHPDWVKKNRELLLITVYNNLKKKVEEFLGKPAITSKDWNWAIINLLYSKKIAKPYYYNTLSILDIVRNEIVKVPEDDPDYQYTEYLLKELISKKSSITRDTFNSIVKEKLNITTKLEQGKGYLSKKRKFPELFKAYESKINTNHKVISVERLNSEEDVYCLEVDTEEHNFPLACGVFVKNCEGLSAAGSLVTGRKDTKTHAVSGLRGKILNVTDKSVDRALESKVINDIFNIIGLGLDVNWVGKDAKTYEEAQAIIEKRSRYGKIVIATDADPDGDAIFNEIVYLFSKFARFLLDHHMVYRAMSPLFRGISKTTGQLTYYYPDDMFDSFGMPIDLDTKHHFDRWKGLGSLTPETGEVYDSFYNPLTRRLVLVTPDGIDYSRGLNENIENRKKLLFDKGILSNPYNFTDL